MDPGSLPTTNLTMADLSHPQLARLSTMADLHV